MLWRETEGDPDLRRRAFAGLARYQKAERPSPPPAAPVHAEAGPARLLRYCVENAAQTNGIGRAPVVVIPSLINPPTVLDLSERRSLMRYLTARGHDPWLVDWGMPFAADAGLDLAGHVQRRLVPLIRSLPRPPALVGYCLGGTLALGAVRQVDARAVATIASPWDFDGFPDTARAEVERLWDGARALCGRIGYVPMEVLQSGFWAMDPARTIHKYAAFGETGAGSQAELAFLAVEDWANGGPPLTYGAGADLFDHLYRENLTGRGAWEVDGTPVDLARLSCPSLSVRSSTDRIVPAPSAPILDEQWTLDLGHVGMIVGGRAEAQLWAPLSEWLARNEA